MLQRPVTTHDSPRWQPIYTSQFLGCIPLSKREAKIKNENEFFVVDTFFFVNKFTLQNLAEKSGGV